MALKLGARHHSVGLKIVVRAESCGLTRHKSRFSPDKSRFTPDGTQKEKFGLDGGIRTYGAVYQKQLPYQLNGPPRMSPPTQSDVSSRFQS